MTTAIYPRNQLTWDLDDLTALVEEGKAKAFNTPKGTHYVVKTDEGSFAVRPEQVVTVPAIVELTPSQQILARYNDKALTNRLRGLVEQYYTLLHGPAENRDGEFAEAELSAFEGLVEDLTGEAEVNLLNKITELQYRAQEKRTGVYIPAPGSSDEDALLAKFGVK